jgi:hypothetical protein
MLEAMLVPLDEPSAAIRLSASAGDLQTTADRETAVQSYPWPARVVSWLALAALLPIVFIAFTRRGLERESNAINLCMLLGLTLVAALAAYAMMGFQLHSGWSATLLVGAVGAALAYNWVVLAKMEDMRV